MKLPSRRRRFLMRERGAGVSMVTSVRVSVPAFGHFHRGGAPKSSCSQPTARPGISCGDSTQAPRACRPNCDGLVREDQLTCRSPAQNLFEEQGDQPL